MRTARSIARVLVVCGLAVVAADAWAEPVRCRGAIVAANAKYAGMRARVLRACEDAVVSGRLPAATDCGSDPRTTRRLTTAAGKMRRSIARACGGADRTCDATDTGLAIDDDLATIGFSSTCGGFQGDGCTIALDDCGDVADCLVCVADGAVDQAIALYYDGPVAGDSHGDGSIESCRRTIGKAAVQLAKAQSEALARCWKRVAGGAPGPCPSSGDFDMASRVIARAEGRLARKLCRGCGGRDRRCDDEITMPSGARFDADSAIAASAGADDVTPATMGFASTCADVVVPGGPACGRPVTTLASLVECVACVTEFAVTCVDHAAVPAFVPYPDECAAADDSK